MNLLKRFPSFAPALLCAASAFAASYKVETFGDVPFVSVDGKAVKSRHFLGWTGGGTTPRVADKWEDFSLDVSHSADTNSAALRILVGNDVSELCVSKLELENLSDGSRVSLYDFSAKPYDKSKLSWLFPKEIRPQPEVAMQNEVLDGMPVLRITKKQKDATFDRLVFHIRCFSLKKGVKYRVHVRAKTDVPSKMLLMAYVLNPYRNLSDNKIPVFGSQVKIAGEAGVEFVHFGVPALCNPADENAKRQIDAAFAELLAANPKARAIVRIPTENAEHRRTHPDEVLMSFDGKPITRGYDGASYSSPSSESFEKIASEGIRNTIEYIESKYADNIAGYHPTGGQSGEFFYGASGESAFGGYDAATLAAWRKWLAEKYKTPEALQKAWRSKTAVPFAEMRVPTPDERGKNTSHLLNPEVSASVADFNAFLQDEMANLVLRFAKTVRETCRGLGRDRLSLVFFGYAYELSGFPNSPAVAGHYALAKILKSPYVDIVSGPISYSGRGLGGVKLSMSAADSFANSGKMWFDEDDNRTYLLWTSGSPQYVADKAQRTLSDTRKVMRRNLSQEIVRNHGSWWMDLFGCGWFNDPEIWREMKDARAAELDMLERPQPYRPEIALIHSDKSVMYIGGNGASFATSRQLLDGGRAAMSCAGTPFGQYILEDALDGKLSAKLRVYLLASALTKREREILATASEKSASMWCWTAGLVDLSENAYSLDAVRELTGFDVSHAGDVPAVAHSTSAGLAAGLPAKFGVPQKVKPLLSPAARDGDTVLAKYADGSNAVVLRTSGRRPQMFVGTTVVPESLYRLMASVSGAHVYTKQPASVYANGAYVSITATTSEAHKIDLGREAEVFDALSGERLGKARVFEFDMKKGDVKFLRLGAGNSQYGARNENVSVFRRIVNMIVE